MDGKKVIIICVGEIHKFPPALNVYYALSDLGYKITVISDGADPLGNDYINLEVDYLYQQTLLKKINLYKRVKKKLNNIINSIYANGDLIWYIGNDAMKYLDDYLLDKNYILHFLELEESICLSRKLHMLEVDIEKYCNKAKAVICCEENRANIMYARWNLKSVPYVIPNKTYMQTSIIKNSDISNADARKVIESIGNKKLVLYQGAITPERRIIEYIKAVDEVGGDYIFGVMTQTEIDMSWLRGHNAVHIPYVQAPMHLEVTSNAYIGIVSYIPTGDFFHSLNALYCAPNKIFEYSQFGIPMIGNRIPGLINTIDRYRAGECADFYEDQIITAIRKIESGYKEYSRGSRELYESVDVKNIIMNILKGCNIVND